MLLIFKQLEASYKLLGKLSRPWCMKSRPRIFIIEPLKISALGRCLGWLPQGSFKGWTGVQYLTEFTRSCSGATHGFLFNMTDPLLHLLGLCIVQCWSAPLADG